MGLAKRQDEEEHERGWRGLDGFVCPACTEDSSLRQKIAENEEHDEECDYCEPTPSASGAAPIDSLIEAVADGLHYEYEDPINQVGWNGREGGYQLATIATEEILLEENAVDDYRLAIAIASAFDHDWVPRNPYSSTPEQRLIWGWEQFADFVKYEKRYTFMFARAHEDHPADESTPPERMLPELAQTIEEANLFTTLPAGTNLYRARAHDGHLTSSAKELGTPPSRFAKANRMTPPGIGGFYASNTRIGAVEEVKAYDPGAAKITVGRFECQQDMRLVDLRNPPSVPSLFDEENRNRRPGAQFLRKFVDAIAVPIPPDDSQLVHYVPTQIVAEYFRSAFDQTDAGQVIGVSWRSAQSESDCMLLFVENELCQDNGHVDSDALLVLHEARTRT